MSKIRFTKEEMKAISLNPSVRKCSEKSITYSKDFKVLAIKRYDEDGLSASQIFVEAGFDLEMIGKHIPDSCVRDWRRIYRAFGTEGLLKERRGGARGKGAGRPKTKNITDKDKIERLEATVAYLKAENDFLAKLRAKRRE